MSAQASNARRGQNHVIGQPSADNKAVVGGGAVWQGVAHAGGGLAVIIGRHGNKRGVRLTHLVPSRRRLQQNIPCFHPSAEPADGRADACREGMLGGARAGGVPSSPEVGGSPPQGLEVGRKVAAGSTPERQPLICSWRLEGTLAVT